MPLVLSVMATTLLAAYGTVLVLGTIAETLIAANYRDGSQVLYAAEAAVEFAIQDLSSAGDWSDMLMDGAQSAFVDGPPGGTRSVGAVSVDLAQATQNVNATARQRWASSPPTFFPYAYGPLRDMFPPARDRLTPYVVVWMADLSANEDAEDGPVIGLIGRAYGATGGRRAVAVALTRRFTDEGMPSGVRVLWWHELR